MKSAHFSPENEPPPPNLYNMGGAIPQKGKNPDPVANWCGLDQLTVSVYGAFGGRWSSDVTKDKNWVGAEPVKGSRGLREILIDNQNLAMERGVAVEVPELGGCLIDPGGGKIAKKYCRFKLELESCIILVADQSEFEGDWPNIKIEINGDHCLCFAGGAPEAYAQAMEFLTGTLGAVVKKERISRVDICADFPGQGMDPFIEAAQGRKWACQSNLYHPYLRPGKTSLYWGAGATILRVYDKLGEMQEKTLKGSPAKYLHMIEKRWGGVQPKKAVRVEYQLRRDALKCFGVTDFKSLGKQTGAMIRYLVGSDGCELTRWSKKARKFTTQRNARWFRFLTAIPEKKHTELNETSPEWKAVQAVFASRFMLPEKLVEIRPKEADVSVLMKQALGVLEAAAANKGFDMPWKNSAAPAKYEFPDYESFEKWLCVMLRSTALGKTEWNFREKVTQSELSEDYELFLTEWEKNAQNEKGEAA